MYVLTLPVKFLEICSIHGVLQLEEFLLKSNVFSMMLLVALSLISTEGIVQSPKISDRGLDKIE